MNSVIWRLRVSLQAIWTALIQRLGLTKTFPSVAPALQTYAQVPEVLWSLTSLIQGGSLDLSDPIQVQIAHERERMTNGELLTPLAVLARRGVAIVALINETGALQAQHIVELAPRPRESVHPTLL